MSLKQLIDLRDKQHELQAVWYRQILTLASGGFALLAGLGPSVPTGIGKYFLAATWVFLGLGIVAGSVATYLAANLAKNLADNFQAQLRQSLREQGHLSISEPVGATPSMLFSFAGPLMIVSLLLAVVSLVVYSVITTLGV